MCKTKFLQMCSFSIISLLSTLWIYHFHCFAMLFLLLYLVSILILYINTLISRIFCISTKIPHPEENGYFSSKRNTPLLLLLRNPCYQIIVYIIWDFINDITKKKLP